MFSKMNMLTGLKYKNISINYFIYRGFCFNFGHQLILVYLSGPYSNYILTSLYNVGLCGYLIQQAVFILLMLIVFIDNKPGYSYF